MTTTRWRPGSSSRRADTAARSMTEPSGRCCCGFSSAAPGSRLASPTTASFRPWPWSTFKESDMKRILLAGILTALSASVVADTIEMKVYGLVCGFCAQGIEKTLRKNPSTEDVVVSLEDKLVAIATRPGQDIADAELTRALTDAGYD